MERQRTLFLKMQESGRQLSMQQEMLTFECEKCGTILIDKSIKFIENNGEVSVKIWCEECHRIFLKQKQMLKEEW